MANNPKSLYIHIPFCAHICSYCDFTKLFYYKQFEKPYLEALKKEILGYNINKVNTLYIGGGTPTSLSDEGFEDLLKFSSAYLSEDYEFTCEANVENLTENKLCLMKKYGVNRLSIGVESTSNKMLLQIGRHHSFEDAQKVVKLAKKYGFNNINIDLIYGFKGQTLEDLKIDLQNFIDLDIDHISIYSLIVEKGSIMFANGEKEQNESDSRKFYDEILFFLRLHGYERYEISNFARNKKYSRHNMTYWKNEEYYGCGLGASGFVNKVRYVNVKNLEQYCKLNYVKEKEVVNEKLDLEYFLITNLRMEQGFKREVFKEKFGKDFMELFEDKITKFSLNNLIDISDERIRLTDEGLMLMDFVILKLL